MVYSKRNLVFHLYFCNLLSCIYNAIDSTTFIESTKRRAWALKRMMKKKYVVLFTNVNLSLKLFSFICQIFIRIDN